MEESIIILKVGATQTERVLSFSGIKKKKKLVCAVVNVCHNLSQYDKSLAKLLRDHENDVEPGLW